MEREDGSNVLHLSIHGRVQGVGYRDAMVHAARALGVSGWVRNRFDGSVEAVVRASNAAQLEALVAWAHRGPPAARVERIERRAARPEEMPEAGAGFQRRPSR